MENENNKPFVGMQYREFDISGAGVRMVDEGERIVELSFSSETPIERFGVGIYEVLSHKRDAVMLERINKTGCLLFNHKRDNVIGKVLEAKLQNKRGVAKVQFDDDEESIKFFNKVKCGTLRNVSVGYRVILYKREEKGKDASRTITYTATRWEPTEISLVSVPADITVGVGRSMPVEVKDPKRDLELIKLKIKNNKNKISFRRKKA